MRTCTIDGCNRRYVGRGLCRAHYEQRRRRGSVTAELGRRDTPAAERFWKFVRQEPGPCWTWTGGANEHGYGILSVGSHSRGTHKFMKAHRVSWELAFGAIPPGLSVLHRCDNPPCVRPDHLFLGTQADNMADMSKKGRHWTKRAA